MSREVSFNDDLYGRTGIKGGCGLLGFARTCSWRYVRHDDECSPGKWRVVICGAEAGEFYTLFGSASAVVDDFGYLRRVP
jgi:hypothetical protein